MTSQIKELTEAVACKGISVRTTNIAETDHDTAKLGRLWQKFHQDQVSHLEEGEDVYGIYHNYERDDFGKSDDLSAFDIVASWKTGTEQDQLGNVVTVNIPTGKYMVFSEQGNMPNTVMNAWERAWAYFNDLSCEHTRVYDVDFEHYIDGNLVYGQVDLYIGIE